MTTNAQLYPLICEIDDYKVKNYVIAIDNILRTTTQIVKDDDEVEYLEEVNKLLEIEYCRNKKLILSKIKIATQHRNLDLEKVKNLPEDILYTIKSYLEPEVAYARKFGVLRMLSFEWTSFLYPAVYLEHTFLIDVPKRIIINLIESLDIGSSIRVKNCDKKERWLSMLVEEVDRLVGNQKSSMRTDKLLSNLTHEYASINHRRIDKWYKFWLNIIVFKKYRQLLETQKGQGADKLTQLKNKKIVVK